MIALAIPCVTPQGHAASLTGLVYINPPSISPTLPVGATFNVTVQVSDMDYFTGWDVYVKTDPSVINPTKITLAGDLFETNYTGATPFETSNCLNGIPGTGCRAIDGPGVAHSGAALLSPPKALIPPILGTLFTITYNVTRVSGFSRIDFILSASAFENGTPTPVPYTTSPGIYGSQPADFSISASPASVNVLQGSNATTTIVVYSLAGFKGVVNLTASEEFRAIFAQPVLNVSPNGSNSTQVILVVPRSTLATDYPSVTVTAANRTVSHSIFVDVNVKTYSDFLLSITPTSLRIHAGSFANTTLVLSSQNGFSGNVSLAVQVPANVTYTLGSSTVALLPGAIVHTSLNVSTPVVSLPFVYMINVTGTATLVASGGVVFHLLHVQQLVVKPPSPSFAVTIIPGTIVVRAGLTSSVTINVRSVDYFWQYVYLSATMSGGAASFDSNSYYVPLPNSKFANVTESVNFTLSVYVPIDQVPGHYIVLLTVYQSPLTQTIGIPVVITSLSPFHSASNPTILGLSPLIYFGMLGALVIPFIALSVSTYRKAREEEDEDWKA